MNRVSNAVRSSVVVCVLSGLFALLSAASAGAAEPVRALDVSVAGARIHLDFAAPVSAAVAARAGDTLVAAVPAQTGEVRMSCTLVFSPSDQNGTLRLERFCNLRQIRWLYTISPQVRAIVVGPVDETGLWFFVDGARQPRNSPHLVPADYMFHGTMVGIDTGHRVDYQDYLTFRHDLGPGGTGSITFAGSIRTI